eukprot:9451732-Pyramimonas_sp.AAC.2
MGRCGAAALHDFQPGAAGGGAEVLPRPPSRVRQGARALDGGRQPQGGVRRGRQARGGGGGGRGGEGRAGARAA